VTALFIERDYITARRWGQPSHIILHLFAVFFDKNLVKYIFGILDNWAIQILHLRIIILESDFAEIND